MLRRKGVAPQPRPVDRAKAHFLVIQQGETVTDSTLSNEQAVALLRKLGTDDEFRARFEDKPALALTEIGLTADEVIRLNARCLTPIRLAEKAELLAIVEQLDQVALQSAMSMIIPEMKLP